MVVEVDENVVIRSGFKDSLHSREGLVSLEDSLNHSRVNIGAGVLSCSRSVNVATSRGVPEFSRCRVCLMINSGLIGE
jgi:hypothetical protein